MRGIPALILITLFTPGCGGSLSTAGSEPKAEAFATPIRAPMEEPSPLQCEPLRTFDSMTPAGLEASDIEVYREHFLVLHDKSNDLYVFDRQWQFIVQISGQAFGEKPVKFEDMDVTGDFIYVTGDFQNKPGEDHSKIFHFRLEGATPAEWRITDVHELSVDLGTIVPKSYGWSADPDLNQFKVEGLAVIHSDNGNTTLWLGVREFAGQKAYALVLALHLDDSSGRLRVIRQWPFPTGIISVQEEPRDRPLRISALESLPNGLMLVGLSAHSSSAWHQTPVPRDQRYAGNQFFLLHDHMGSSPHLLSRVLFPGSKLEGVTWDDTYPEERPLRLDAVFDNDPGIPKPGYGWPSEWTTCTLQLPLDPETLLTPSSP